MSIKIFASLAIAAATVLTACSGDNPTPPPTKAQLCTNGLSADCLMGTWSINGPSVPSEVTSEVGSDIVYLVDKSHDLSASPAMLKFYVDEKNANKFEYTHSALSVSECRDAKIYGDWSIIGTSLRLYANKNNVCMAIDDFTFDPVIKTDLMGNISLQLNNIFFMEPEMKGEDNVTKNVVIEVFNFVSEN